MTSEHLITIFMAIDKELKKCPICNSNLCYKNKELFRTIHKGDLTKNICINKITVSCECGWRSEIAMPERLFYDPTIFLDNGLIKYQKIFSDQQYMEDIIFSNKRVYSHPMNWKLNKELINEIVLAVTNNGVKGEITDGMETKNRLSII